MEIEKLLWNTHMRRCEWIHRSFYVIENSYQITERRCHQKMRQIKPRTKRKKLRMQSGAM